MRKIIIESYRVIKMKKLIPIILICLFLGSCGSSNNVNLLSKKTYGYRAVCIGTQRANALKEVENMNAIWVSQFDMQPIFRDGSQQRDENDYRSKVNTMLNNLKRDGFDTVFLQLRPNGDSMYKSEYYPTSKYIAGVYGGTIGYDAISIYLEEAKKKNIAVHGWINPYRLCSENELKNHHSGVLYDWYCEGIGKRIEKGADGLLYLDPAYEEAHELIANGAREILNNYDFDGIHIDDYFYPTEFEFDDNKEFFKSNFTEKGDFRRENVNKTVVALYNAVHEYNGKIFGIAPAGNIYSLKNGWYADIYKWLSESGYVDYIMPQLYFGFENAYCPFENILNDWVSAIKVSGIKLYIGLSAAKCALGSKGFADTFAGESGKYEWRDNKDILARSCNLINSIGADGVCIFAYSSFYNPLTGEGNTLTDEERNAFVEANKRL